jgi:DNA-directed RNA polymerase subunit RPC12/RpoP
MEYKCTECGCEEFISQPDQYSIFENKNGILVFKKAELLNDKLELFCRECSEKLEFKEEDVKF